MQIFNHKLEPIVKFFILQDAVVVLVVSGQDDAGVGGGETGHGETELVKVEHSVAIAVDNIPVFDAKVVEEFY